MAYDAFGNYTGDQLDPYEAERLRQEEEERKRREEEERLARLANVAAPVAPVAPVDAMGNQTGGFMDQLGSRIGNAVEQRVQGVKDRFGQVQTAFEDPAKAFQDRMDAAAPVKPDEVVHKEQIETRADGSKVVKTTQEVPVVAQTQEAGAGRGFVNPAPVAPTAPATNAVLPADYNERIAQMESGNNPNIGYHDRARSSAFGKYGITDKAWSDAQRANPALANVQKDQATPEQMEQAQSTVTSNNSRYLTKLGVEVNPNTLAAAHFIGAQGLANYLRDGSISPGAVKANGGYEKTKQIIDQRLGGAFAPASGAAMQAVAPVAPTAEAVQTAPTAPEAVSPYSLSTGATGQGLRMPAAPAPTASPVSQAISTYQAVQNDPMALLKMRSDESVPAFIRERAGAQAYELLNRERKTAAAEQQVEKMVASGDQSAIAKTLATKPKTEEGSFLKAVLYAKLGLTDLAKDEQEKLGAGTKWTSVTGPDGENALVKVAANGRPLEGVKADGSAFSDEELVKFGGGGTLGKGASLSSEVYVDQATGQRYRSGFDNSGKSALVNIQGGAAYRGDPKNLKIQSIDTAAQKAEGAAAVKLKYAGPTSYTEAGAKAAGEFNFNNGTNIGYASQQPGAPLVDLNTGKPVAVSANGVITTTQTGTPGAAVTTTAPAAGGVSPQAITQGQAVNKVAQEQFVRTTAPEINTMGNDGRDVASIRRQQLGIVSSNPSILNIYNGTGDTYDRARNVISKLLTGSYNENNSGDFYKDVKATGLNESERGAIEAMWNLNSSINSKTLKANAGAGAVSNADMKANKEANLGNFTETTPLGALQVLNRSKFTGDMAAAKAAYLAANPGLNDDTKFNSAWAKESSKYTKAYEGIADARAEFLKPFRPPQGASKEQLDMFKDKVFKSFEMYPVPAFDNETGKWTYGTANAERAAARKLLGR